MDKQTQINFVTELSAAVVKELIADIEKGKTPEEWDGIELRQLLADRFDRAVFAHTFTRSRRREYNNTKSVNNL